MHHVWHTVRGPFRAVACADHRWERYDVHRAGCLLCGACHECTPDTVGSVCPFAQLDDGSICCTITAFSPAVVRYSKHEYTDTAAPPENRAQKRHDLFDEVHGTVEWFLMGDVARACKTEEAERTLQRCATLLVKTLKQQKVDSAGDGVGCLPCLLTALARITHQLSPRPTLAATHELCEFCARHITKCLVSLGIGLAQNRRVSTVVGLLYLMKQGLVIQNAQWLPRVSALVYSLPHETCLEKYFKLSMKLVCETENEIKLALRQKIHKL
jgi:hypothetical protein